MTAEVDEVESAMELAEIADKAFAEVESLYPGRRAHVQKLREDSAAYAALAKKTSVAFIDGEIDVSAEMARMNEALEHLRAELADFSLHQLRQLCYDTRRVATLG